MKPTITDPASIHEILDRYVLANVETPAQYLDGEVNSARKDPTRAEVSIALCFPDLYNLGMSHLGYQILYHVINRLEWAAADRAYAPWPDMQQQMRRRGLPLYAIESLRPVRSFDAVGFTLQSEILYTNVLMMLRMAGIPLERRARGEDDPVVIAGGPAAGYPEPMAEFIDLFFIGDGEGSIVRFAEVLREARSAGASREEVLLQSAREVPGVYAPAFYEPRYEGGDGPLVALKPTRPDVPERVRAARVDDFETAPFPDAPIVPFVSTVHDRITLEIMRGCSRGCRFCHAGMSDRPARHRSPERLFRQAVTAYENTGHDEIGLCSLSSSDYPHLRELLERLVEHFNPLGVSISLPSLRVSDQLEYLVGPLSSVRKSGLTLAPEAATERLRAVINKDISAEELLEGTAAARREGWRRVKLYFMVGLPTETDEDVRAIGTLCERVRRNASGQKGGLRLNVTVSPFVPKPHTPFQWEPMISVERMERDRSLILESGSNRSIRYKFHNPRRSVVEAVLSRGDRRLGRAVREVYEDGGQFDGWNEHFVFERWSRALGGLGVSLAEGGGGGANSPFRRRDPGEALPWDHIDVGVRREFLVRERERAVRGEFTADCRSEGCHECGACPDPRGD